MGERVYALRCLSKEPFAPEAVPSVARRLSLTARASRRTVCGKRDSTGWPGPQSGGRRDERRDVR
jgi:hypothetical protein